MKEGVMSNAVQLIGYYMLNKRYQVFISSTYIDLQEERKLSVRAVLDCDCFPAGMELFPAIDESQFEYIKKVIDDSDYYLLLIGARYGSVDFDGISFTEKEYQYAKHKGIPIIALLHKNPESLLKESENLDHRLKLFIEEVKSGRMVAFFSAPMEVAYEVQKSLNYLKRKDEAIGWMRGDNVLDPKVVVKYAELQNENAELRNQVASLKNKIESPANYNKYSHGVDKVNLEFKIIPQHGNDTRIVMIERTWDYIFSLLGLSFHIGTTTPAISSLLRIDGLKEASKQFNIPNTELIEINKISVNKIIVQLVALGFIRKDEEYEDKWIITPFGNQYLSNLLADKKE